MKLFDVLSNMKEFDDELITRKVKKLPFAGYLSTAKNQLFHAILKTLRGYYVAGSIDLQLQEILQEAELLFNKSLFESCLKITEKGKKISRENECFVFYLHFLQWEQKILDHIAPHNKLNVDLLKKSLNENDEGINLYINFIENKKEKFEMLFETIPYLETINEENKEKINNYIAKDVGQEPSFRSKIMRQMTKRHLYEKLNEPEKAHEALISLAAVYEKAALVQNDFLISYFHCLEFLAIKSMGYRDFSKATAYIQQAGAIAENFNDSLKFIKTKLKGLIDLLTIFKWIVSGSVDENRQNIKNIESQIRHLRESYNPLWINLVSAIAYAYFTIGDFKKSRRLFYDLLNEAEGKMLKSHVLILKIMLIVSSYELRDYDLMEHTISTLNRQLNKKEGDFLVEKQLLVFFKGLLEITDLNKKTACFKKFRQSEPMTRLIFEPRVFNYHVWLDSKIKNTNMNDVFKGRPLRG